MSVLLALTVFLFAPIILFITACCFIVWAESRYDWWKRRRKRLDGLDIVRRIQARDRMYIPQFPADIEWMKYHFDTWLKENPRYRKVKKQEHIQGATDHAP